MQRMGRAARTKAGYYFRVCLKEQHVAMQEMPDPEILRVSLSGPVLDIIAMQEEPAAYLQRALHKPPCDKVNEAMRQLFGLHLASGDHTCPWITRLDRVVRPLRVELPWAVSLIASCVFGVPHIMALVCAIVTQEKPACVLNNAARVWGQLCKMWGTELQGFRGNSAKCLDNFGKGFASTRHGYFSCGIGCCSCCIGFGITRGHGILLAICRRAARQSLDLK